MSLNNQAIVYLAAFSLMWFATVSASIYPALVAVIVIAFVTDFLLKKSQKIPVVWWQTALMSIAVAEVFFAVSFWSTPVRNKALIMIVVLYVFSQWFDKINTRWLIGFLLILLGALLLVPFQAV